jgi:hypothetical protein
MGRYSLGLRVWMLFNALMIVGWAIFTVVLVLRYPVLLDNSIGVWQVWLLVGLIIIPIASLTFYIRVTLWQRKLDSTDDLSLLWEQRNVGPSNAVGGASAEALPGCAVAARRSSRAPAPPGKPQGCLR